MTEHDPIHQLLRLKRHEQPAPDFTEDFLRTFHQRQRAELLQNSARGLLWERITTYFEDLMSPKWGWATSSVAAVALLAFTMKPASSGKSDFANNSASESFEIKGVEVAPEQSAATNVRYLISRHNTGGLSDPTEAQGKPLPASFHLSDDMGINR
jgi:hypothetical protein